VIHVSIVVGTASKEQLGELLIAAKLAERNGEAISVEF